MNTTGNEWSTLRTEMGAHFDTNDLRTLVFDLSLDWGELAGETKTLKIQAIIEYLRNRGRLADLLVQLYQKRPLVPWPDLPADETWVGHNVVVDDFENGSRHFRLGDYDSGQTREKTAVANQLYRWEIEALTAPTSTVILPTGNPQTADFVLRADLMLHADQSLAYGLFFRNGPSHNCYFLLWGGSQRYKFSTLDRSQNASTDNIPWTDSHLVDLIGFNQLKVVAKGDKATLSVNGEVVNQLASVPSAGGQVGVIAFFNAPMTAVVEMSRFHLLILD